MAKFGDLERHLIGVVVKFSSFPLFFSKECAKHCLVMKEIGALFLNRILKHLKFIAMTPTAI